MWVSEGQTGPGSGTILKIAELRQGDIICKKGKGLLVFAENISCIENNMPTI